MLKILKKVLPKKEIFESNASHGYFVKIIKKNPKIVIIKRCTKKGKLIGWQNNSFPIEKFTKSYHPVI